MDPLFCAFDPARIAQAQRRAAAACCIARWDPPGGPCSVGGGEQDRGGWSGPPWTTEDQALLRVERTPGFLNGLLSGPLLHRGGDARAAGLAFLAKQAGATVPPMSPAAWGLFAQDPRVRFASSWVARVLVRSTSTRWTRSERETASRLIFSWLP